MKRNDLNTDKLNYGLQKRIRGSLDRQNHEYLINGTILNIRPKHSLGT